MLNKKNNFDYTTVTEIPAIRASQEQLNNLYTRYKFASEYCKGINVLEVACGAGIGIGYLSRFARKVTGGDIDKNNLKFAMETYRGHNNITLQLLDAHELPFENESFNTVLLFEAIYYLAHPETFIAEAYRVLRKKGTLIICTANKDWAGFNPSPFSFKYYSAPELCDLIKQKGFSNVKFYCDCPAGNNKISYRLISFIKKTAVTFNLIPKTMKGKEFLKRIFMGRLVTLPPEIKDNMSVYTPPIPVACNSPVHDYKVLYAVAFK